MNLFNFSVAFLLALGGPAFASSAVVEFKVAGTFIGSTVEQPDATVGSVDIDSLHYSPDTDIDADVAVDGRQREDRRLQYIAPSSCPDGYVLYNNGITNGTCGDDCCVGYFACFGFSGCVKKDGSCVGRQACQNLKAGFVEGSCKGGNYTCTEFGTVETIIDSCTNGVQACLFFAYNGGQVGDVTDSCNSGDLACYRFAYNGGIVGDVTNSCNDGERACSNFAAYNGIVGNVTDSCSNGNSMCEVFAFNGGQVGDVTNSCTRTGLSCSALFSGKVNGTDVVNYNTQGRADLPFSWDIESSEMTIAFGDDSLDKELQIAYNISNKDYNVTVMSKNCTSVVSTDIISVNTSEVSSPTHIQLIVSADINITAVVGSAVWTTPATANSDLAYIDFCVRLDLWHDGTSMNFLERDISLQLNMTSESFDVTASKLNRTEGQAVDEEVDAEYVVEACQCTALLQCVTIPEEKTLTQGDSLYLCLKASTAEVIVSDIKALTISQTSSGGSTVTQNPVADGETSALTSVTTMNDATNDNELNIRTQLISAFFDQDNAPLVVSGVAKLAFKNGRKLLAEIVDVRNLQQETQDPLSAQFNIAVNLKSNAEEENVFSDGTRAGVSCAFPIINFVVAILLPIIAANCMH